MPDATDEDYQFDGTSHPPILEGLFHTNFYGCNKACAKAKLDIYRIFHECNERNRCGKSPLLERLPRRLKKWEIDDDEEKDEAWGLHVLFAVSFYKVLLYHSLILLGPLIFWGIWLKKWPRDWQNGSIPFFAVVVLLSLFWLPFAHNGGSREERKHKME